ncbi:RNA polymerase sigma factor [Prescottella agglutinans]|uniref:RNA polymerase sigma factor n=1 Tax=Prescottella agglutinans TaxID=1644129 RepID=UPI003D974F22
MDTDEVRFTEMYRLLYRRVRAYAGRRAPDQIAQEAADEAFLIAWRKLDQLPADPLPWLLVATRHALSEHRRREDKQLVLIEWASSGSPLSPPTAPAADDEALERLSVLAALETLPEQDRETLMLTVWDGLSYRQSAEVVGCSTTAFAVRHHRARRRLSAALAIQDSSGTPSIQMERDAT